MAGAEKWEWQDNGRPVKLSHDYEMTKACEAVLSRHELMGMVQEVCRAISEQPRLHTVDLLLVEFAEYNGWCGITIWAGQLDWDKPTLAHHMVVNRSAPDQDVHVAITWDEKRDIRRWTEL